MSLPGGGAVSQTVTLAPERPRRGDAFLMRSVVQNTGPQTIQINTSMCLTLLGGTLSVDEPSMACAAVSLPADLAPGDSVTIERELHANSPPGTYHVTVQHLVEPVLFVTVEVTVLP
jgi:hypothetical protein